VTTIIVAGAIANKCGNGGAAWTRLSWALGLQRLGFTVRFVEHIRREDCVDRSGQPCPFEESVNLAFFREVTGRHGLAGSAALVYDGGDQVDGASWRELVGWAAQADALVNISGHLALDPLVALPGSRIYIDLDPGYTQFWHASGVAGSRLEGHDHFFTVGVNIGSTHCPIPTCGIEWRPIPQPSVLDLWPESRAGDRERFTTIASWRGPYGRVEHASGLFGLKAHEFRKFIEVPTQSDACFEIVLDIHPGDGADLRSLAERGWNVVNPADAVPDPDSYRSYIQSSGAEFSAAQGIYVETESGWFSDRTVRYLTSGKPALVQDTGFGNRYPTGEGLLTFRTLDEALAGVEQIRSDYDRHCARARAIATEFFDSDVVLGELADAIGVAP
jgi:hypothetical protein